jgi:hypothetical protein
MTILIDWHNPEKNLLVERYIDKWTTQDVYWMVDKAYEMLASVDHPVDIVVDYVNSDSSITNLIASSTLSLRRYVDKRTHPNSRFIVLVGATTLLRTALKVKMLRPKAIDKAQFVDTFEDAILLINSQRPLIV